MFSACPFPFSPCISSGTKFLWLLRTANGAYLMEAKSDQIHTIWATPSYGMGAVVFSPNDYFSPNSQQRWVGLIFNGESLQKRIGFI